MTVSIIVAVKKDNPNLRECIENCLKLNYPDFELIVLPDKKTELDYPKTTVIPTGEVTPPHKRDIAIKSAKGEILAFIDDDAYPAPDWLNKALRCFDDSEIAAVGGPAVTPDSDTMLQKASGLVYASWLVSGPYTYRYLPKKRIQVDDFPSCNFLIRKDTIVRLGGFGVSFWPGEDTILCLKLVKELKKSIIYEPQALVYHHRRRLFKSHLRQIANYALHRGYFVRKFPGNSLKFAYFLPSLFVLGVIFGAPLSFINPLFMKLYAYILLGYLATVFIFSLKRDFRLTGLVFWGIIFSHIFYGIYFIAGLLIKNLKEE